MANHTVAASAIGKYEIALAANTEDVVTFGSGDSAVTQLPAVEIKVLSGTKPVYFKFGTGAATVKGADCYDAHPGTAVVVTPKRTGTDTVVHLISEAAAVVSVSAA